MDHPYIHEHQVVALYAMERLDPADRAAFEEHMLDCRECQDELELTTDFKRALTHVSVAEQPRPQRRFSAFTWPVFTAAACLLIAGLPGLWLWNQNRRLERDMEGMRTAAA